MTEQTKKKNLYEILGIEETATPNDIRKAYRRKALEYHPDKNAGSQESHKRFVEVGQAYETISDPNKRRQYDTRGRTERRDFKSDENFTETVKRYKEKFYQENRDLFLSQIDDSTKILYAGFDPPIDISIARTHRSKSNTLPIIQGEKAGSNVKVTSIGYNFHSYFLGVELLSPVVATLLYPISGLFGRYALSDHTDPKGAPAVTNFEKAYHNRTPLHRFGVECNSPLQAALAIRYLNEVSKLPAKKIFDLVLDKTNYGKIDGIDFNAVGGDGEAALARILNLSFEKFAYYDFDVINAPALFKRLNVDWFDTEIGRGRSSVHVEFAEQPLPALPIPQGALYIPTTEEMRALGLAEKVPAKSRKHKNDHAQERNQMSKERIVSDDYHRAEWGNTNWTINTPNGLDTAMTAFMLNHVLVPTLSYFAPERLMLPKARPKLQFPDSLEKKLTG